MSLFFFCLLKGLLRLFEIIQEEWIDCDKKNTLKINLFLDFFFDNISKRCYMQTAKLYL